MLQKSLFLFLLCSFSLSALESAWDRYKQQTIRVQAKLPGWCSTTKALRIMDFIYENKPKVCVEIGTYGGATSFPIARALLFIHSGILYTIDAWDNKVAIEGLEDDLTREYWATVDFKNIERNFRIWMKIDSFSDKCKVLKATSALAAKQFLVESIDFLYIDGNFSSSGSLLDVTTYLPLVRKGGYVFLNDADLETKQLSVEYLMKTCTHLPERSMGSNLLVFQKP